MAFETFYCVSEREVCETAQEMPFPGTCVITKQRELQSKRGRSHVDDAPSPDQDHRENEPLQGALKRTAGGSRCLSPHRWCVQRRSSWFSPSVSPSAVVWASRCRWLWLPAGVGRDHGAGRRPWAFVVPRWVPRGARCSCCAVPSRARSATRWTTAAGLLAGHHGAADLQRPPQPKRLAQRRLCARRR